MKANQKFRGSKIVGDDRAVAGLSSVGAFALLLAVIVVGAVVGMIVLSTLAPSYINAAKNLSQNVTNADWGNTTANSLSPVLGLVIALGAMFAFVSLAFLAFIIKRGRGSA